MVKKRKKGYQKIKFLNLKTPIAYEYWRRVLFEMLKSFYIKNMNHLNCKW